MSQGEIRITGYGLGPNGELVPVVEEQAPPLLQQVTAQSVVLNIPRGPESLGVKKLAADSLGRAIDAARAGGHTSAQIQAAIKDGKRR